MNIASYCNLSGDTFNATAFEKMSGIELSVRNGIASFASDTFKEDKQEVLDNLLNKLIINYTNLIDCGVDTIHITLNLQYENQCNWEITTSQIKKLNFLEAKLLFSAYK
jgi:hypothetical protein